MKNLLKPLAMASLLILSGCSNEELNEEFATGTDVESNLDNVSLSGKLNTVFQAEDYDSQSGIQVSGGWKVGWVNNGDWIKFDDFDHSGATSITVTASSNTSGGTIQFRKGSATGGNLLAEVDVSGTGGWNNMQEFTANITGSSSNSDLYVVFTGGSGYLLDIDSFEFTSGSSGGGTTTEAGRFEQMVGKTVRLENTSTNDWLRSTSNTDYADCEMVAQSNTGTRPQWIVEEVNDGGNYYYRFKNVSSNRRFRPEASGNNQNINLGKTSWTGNWTQWEISSNTSGEYVLKNRSTGTYLSAASSTDGTIALSVNSENSYTTWRIEDLSGDDANGDGGGSTGGGSSDTPGGILGLTNNDWKLNGFTANPSSSATYYDDVMDQVNGNIATWENSNYFFENNDWAYFKCYRGLGSSSNSNNPRVELREMDGGDEEEWNGDSGSHIMSFTVRVDQLPNGWDDDDDEERTTGTLCFAQIHGPSGTNNNGVEVDDTIRVQFEGTRGQTSGSVKLKISGYITEDVLGGSQTFTGYSLDTSYDMQLRFINDVVSLVVDGNVVFSQEMDTSGDGSYFKIGNYLQSVQNGSFDGSYGLVGLKNLSISGH